MPKVHIHEHLNYTEDKGKLLSLKNIHDFLLTTLSKIHTAVDPENLTSRRIESFFFPDNHEIRILMFEI